MKRWVLSVTERNGTEKKGVEDYVRKGTGKKKLLRIVRQREILKLLAKGDERCYKRRDEGRNKQQEEKVKGDVMKKDMKMT